MIFFDFLYYRICRFYESFGEKGAEGSASFIIGGFMAMNVFLIVMLVNFFTNANNEINKLLVVGVAIIFMAFNYIRYVGREKKSVDVIERKWLARSRSSRNFITFLHVIYGVATVGGFFGVAIYIGSQR